MPGKLTPIELEDITRYRIPSAPLWSPDGHRLAFQVTSADRDKNEYHTDVWLYENGVSRQLTWSLDASILFWEDPETLVLRRAVKDALPETTDLFRIRMDGGEAQPWLSLPFPLQKIEKLGDAWVASGMIRANDPDAYLDGPEERKKKAESRKSEQDYQVMDEVPYWMNGAGFINGQRTALFLVREQSGNAVCRRLTDPFFSVDSFCVSGETVFYAGTSMVRRISLFNQVYRFDLSKGKSTAVYRKADLSFGSLFVMEGVLYGHASDMKTYGVNQTSDLCRIEKNKVTKVYVPEVSLYSSVVGDTAEGGSSQRPLPQEYVTLATVDAHNAVFSFRRQADGSLSCETLWEQEGMACSMDATEKQIALVYQDWAHVAEVFVLDRATGAFTRVTKLNDAMLAGRYIAHPEPIAYQSAGYDLHGWVLLPQGFSPRRKYPAILDVHGGPRCVYSDTFFHEMQLWAARGYVVFFTNIKGSDGRGDAFADIRNDYGGTDYQNLMDFTDAVLAKYPNIDTSRLCETGGSYGGFMTNWIIGHTDRFCCAASQRSISNWISFGFTSDIGGYFAPDQNGAHGMFGPANTDILWQHSPLKYADSVRTPTLFIHSDEDYRCPLPEGMQMMQALAQRNIETRMCVFHGENHELSRSGKPKHRIRRLEEITGWFDAHTKK